MGTVTKNTSGAMIVGLLLAALAMWGACGGGDDVPGGGADGSVTPGADAGPNAGGDAGQNPGADGGQNPGADAGPAGADPGDLGTATSSSDTATASAGGENIDITVHMPDAAGPLPIVVFTHGFQLTASQYSSYGAHLASWGYIVVMPDFGGGLIGAPTHTELKVKLKALIGWIADNATNASGPLAGKGDASKIGLAGHSMGGKISLLTATEDNRPKAVFGVDPVDAAGGPFGGDPDDYPSVTPELMSQITVPIVLLGETTNGTAGGLGQACAPEDNNFHQYYVHAASPALEIEVMGANHMSFLDNPDCGFTCSACPKGSDDTAVTRRLTKRYMTAFFNAVLRGQNEFRSYLTGDNMGADETAGLVKAEAKNSF